MKIKLKIAKHRGYQATIDFLKIQSDEDLKVWKRKYPEFVFNMEKLDFGSIKKKRKKRN